MEIEKRKLLLMAGKGLLVRVLLAFGRCAEEISYMVAGKDLLLEAETVQSLFDFM